MTCLRFILLLLLALPLAHARAEEAHNVDPFESFNRKMFVVNDKLDAYLIRPIAKGYQFIFPRPVQRGISNMFANMYDFSASVNGVLQFRLVGAGQSGGRFVVNSTLGFLGIFDVATRMGIRPYRTDFGHTLAIWGARPGPYLMVPFFGPRTVRSGTGTIFDTYISIPTYLSNVRLRNTLWGMELIDGRASLLQAEELMSGDRYIFVRDAYLQQREYFVNDGVVEDNFSDFDDAWDEEF